jgi:hypothetical protein
LNENFIKVGPTFWDFIWIISVEMIVFVTILKSEIKKLGYKKAIKIFLNFQKTYKNSTYKKELNDSIRSKMMRKFNKLLSTLEKITTNKKLCQIFEETKTNIQKMSQTY